MLVAVIAEPSYEAALDVIATQLQAADIIELRVDYFNDINLSALQTLRAQINKPLIITLRSVQNGGYYQNSEPDRLTCLRQLAELEPEYIDLEYDVDPLFIEAFHKHYPNCKIIRSYHNFSHTPDDLSAILQRMQHPAVDSYKVVTKAQSSIDSLRMAHFVKEHPAQFNLTGHCMGELGSPSRILGAIVGNQFHYASVGTHIPAPGCLALTTLVNTYRLQRLNADTAVYALLGDPVEHSIGHIFHNQQFVTLQANAVYLKFTLNAEELTDFFQVSKALPFKGFSITMPLKTAVLPFVDTVETEFQALGAVNTLRLHQGKISAINTDGSGAIQALQQHIQIRGSTLLLLGAGGAAKAIAHQACRSGAQISIVNRSLANAKQLAAAVEGEFYDFSTFAKFNHKPFDIIINTLPNKVFPIERCLQLIRSVMADETVLMNIDYSQANSDLKQLIPCKLIEGQQMFERQALQQLVYWGILQ